MIINEAKATGVKQNSYLHTANQDYPLLILVGIQFFFSFFVLPLETNPINIQTVISQIGWKLK